jgi:alpha-L-fucosidase
VDEGIVKVRHRDGGTPVSVKAGRRVEAFAGAPVVQVTPTADRTARHAADRFGVLIHWGLYSVTGGAWKGKTGYNERIMQQAGIPLAEYEALADRFHPAKFDAGAWARLVREAGARYVLFMAKHHDGFCLFDSALTDYTVVKATPFRRDVLKELAAACAAEGLRLGVGYSSPDWHHPDFPASNAQGGFHGVNKPDADLAAYAAYLRGQVRELLTGYGPVSPVWLVTAGGTRRVHPDERLHARTLGDEIRKLQPTSLLYNPLDAEDDFDIPQESGRGVVFDDFLKLSPQVSWNRDNTTWTAPAEAIRKLVGTAASGRNLLACVGPTDEGVIPQPQAEILRRIGAWLAVNGESIYGTKASPLSSPPAWGRVTAGTGRLYLHVFAWPADGKLVVPGLKTAVQGAGLLADPAGKPLGIRTIPAGLEVTLPAAAPDPVDTVVVLETGAG